MKTLIAISSVVVGAILAPQNPQDSTAAPATPRGLTKVAPQDSSKGRAQAPQLSPARPFDEAQSLEEWREQLANKDLAARERAFERLVAAARHDSAFADTVRDWSADAKAPELAWTARLALRELKTQPFDIFGWPGLDLHDLKLHGLQLPGLDPAAPFDPNSLFEQLQKSWPDSSFGGAPGGLGAPGDTSSSCESFSLNIAPDGVTCTIKRDIDGQEVTEEYQAESLEKLLEAHPELSDKLRAGNGPFGRLGVDTLGRFHSPDGGALLRFDPFGSLNRGLSKLGAPAPGADNEAIDLAPLRTDVLGVVVQPLSEAETKQLDLEAGVGLRIMERVNEGTIAYSMGLQRGQVLIEMNGRALETRDDITAELKKRGAEGQIECVVIDRWGQRRTHTWKPDPGRQL